MHNHTIPTTGVTLESRGNQWFASDPPLSSFNKMIVSTPRLLHNLLTMSVAKAVPDRLKDPKCKKIALRKRTPIPY